MTLGIQLFKFLEKNLREYIKRGRNNVVRGVTENIRHIPENEIQTKENMRLLRNMRSPLQDLKRNISSILKLQIYHPSHGILY